MYSHQVTKVYHHICSHLSVIGQKIKMKLKGLSLGLSLLEHSLKIVPIKSHEFLTL